jgi:DNA-binding transcriptional regulator YiaG
LKGQYETPIFSKQEFFVDAAMIKQLRKTTKLSQARFAALRSYSRIEGFSGLS